MKRDISKLHKKTITDKTGHSRTVWVKNDEAKQSSNKQEQAKDNKVELEFSGQKIELITDSNLKEKEHGKFKVIHDASNSTFYSLKGQSKESFLIDVKKEMSEEKRRVDIEQGKKK